MQVTTTSPLFAATLRPDRNLRLAGGWIALALATIVGTPFLIAIPEFVLPGLVALALAIAGLLALGMRQARQRRTSQQVTLWADQLEIATVTPGTEKHLQRFDPKTVRLRLTRDAFERTTGVFLRHADAEIELGGFLSNADKSSFAKAFGVALRKARRAA
ncbi:DUF2244 domain-containing protein [Devosia sp. XJ19-1]|uniref:DUF2244 domain-containing protein n=1 Tax=Devosia ureilytica TaxID=2952754 RepID=A0A9Q4ANB5_9HYPH|nr:DUF2244 domain-containing protein [Devosia ureilytica]MCP8882919.1 DUF2244 domain-containing protein [Devosia ureilytica]MCP8886713.1 DUF2244 domain-containing protein [Devosia ureilytica]